MPDRAMDSGARIDSGSPRAALDSGHPQDDASPKSDAQASLDGAIDFDSGTDAETTDAFSPNDASEIDAGLIDTGLIDTGLIDSGMMIDAGFADAQGAVDVGSMPIPDAGQADSGVLIGMQSGELVITEVMGFTDGLEWIELRNVSGIEQDLRQFYLQFDSRPGVSLNFRFGNDPSGTSTAAFVLPAYSEAYFVLNPVDANLIPIDAHLYGSPGQFGGNGFVDSGDKITLYRGSVVVDALEITDIATASNRQITATQFPLILNVSTQLSSHIAGAISANANDFAGLWCAPIWRGSTPGQVNHNCNWFVISEVLYDYDSVAGGSDNGHEFVEIAGAVGAQMIDLQVVAIQGSPSAAGMVIDSDNITGLRMPGNGLYLLADQASAGQTYVNNVDQIVDLQLQNGPDAVQLLRVTAVSGVTYFDSFGYGALTPNLSDSAHMQAAYEGTPVSDMATRTRSANWARALNQADSQDNAADFFHDPSPTPGKRNEPSVLQLLSVQPDNALASDSATVSFSGVDFTDFMQFTINGDVFDSTNCTDISANEIQCRISLGSTGTAAPNRNNVYAESRPDHGQSAILVDGFTWSVSVNETDDPKEADYCTLQHPATLTMSSSTASDLVYGRIYEGGLTDVTSGPSSSIRAELGYGPLSSDPTQSNDWRWFSATFNLEYGNDDEYQSVFSISTPGDYLYSYRFSLDDGSNWTVCDLDGAGSNGGFDFSTAQLGRLTVTP